MGSPVGYMTCCFNFVSRSDNECAISQMFKLEDVAMGIWIADMKDVLKVRYEKEERVYNEGCKDGYVVAHYQGPREMLCLWQKLQEGNGAKCCGDR